MNKAELIEQAETLGIKVDGRWSEETLQKKVSTRKGLNDGSLVAVLVTGEADIVGEDEIAKYVNSRVRAIWEGQSRDLPIHERKGRIIKALKEKGLPVEDIQWPFA